MNPKEPISPINNKFFLGNNDQETIKIIQQKLIASHFLRGKPDGFFGVITKNAVINFQFAVGLPATGIVDSKTWEQLILTQNEPPLTTRPTLKSGDTGIEVKHLQLYLTALGFNTGTADGIFGRNTRNAVLAFQATRNLVPTGIVDSLTWRDIDNLFAASDTPIPTLMPTIKENDHGSEVSLLQKMLSTVGYPIYEGNGFFDKQTTQQVIKFQKDNNLIADGIVGPQTWDSLFMIITPPYHYPIIHEGDSGDEVKILQDKLQILGYFAGTPTGSFDKVTASSVKQFQSNNGLISSGIVDRTTWNYLMQATQLPIDSFAVIGRPTLQYGDSGQYVKMLQEQLTDLSFYNGVIDGNFGTGTLNAVKAFQTTNKLTADGIVGRGTWSALVNLYSPLAICGATPLAQGIVIDPGHGGSDPGASGNGIIEKEYVLKMSQYMYNRLRELKIPAFITRDSDISLPPNERVAKIKSGFGDLKGIVLISNHLNSSGGRGAEAIYALRSKPDLPRRILLELEKEGQVTRSYFQRSLPDDATKDYFYIMRDTVNIEPVLVEYGFLDNSEDALLIKRYWDKYAEAALRAILYYKDLPYTAPVAGKIVYIVRAGDTLFSIATRFNTTVSAIQQLNNLTTTTLQIGQQLFVPGENVETTPPSGNLVYVVKAGDSLFSIATKFDTTVTQIKTLNNLTSDLLRVGQQLFIPGISIDIPPTSNLIYTVVAGDTLYSIARSFNTTIDEIRRLNNLTSDTLQVGQRLLLPRNDSTTSSFIYVVRAGDTLFALANRFNTTVSEIRRLNNLTSDTLQIGQKLIIPGLQS